MQKPRRVRENPLRSFSQCLIGTLLRTSKWACGGVLASGMMMGCVVDDSASLYISHNATPDDDCIYSVDAPARGSGHLNVDLATDYIVYPVYNSNLRNRGSSSQADPNVLQIQRAQVRLMDQSGTLLSIPGVASEFEVPTSTFVGSTSSETSPHQAVGAVTVIPAGYPAALGNLFGTGPRDEVTILVGLVVLGETIGDVSVESEEWLWPVSLCRGNCLTACVGPDDDPIVSCAAFQDSVTGVVCTPEPPPAP